MPAKKIVLSHDPALLEILEGSFFQREGFELVLVKDGQTAFQAVEGDAPTLAVFDLALLGEQALVCCQAIKRDPLLATTPLLLLLPQAGDDGLAEACWEAGCDAVLHRPLDADRFLDAACKLIGISRRLARRHAITLPVVFFDQNQERYTGHCINLNLGGLFLAAEDLFPMDTQLEIEWQLPGIATAMRSRVRVAWVNHPEWHKKKNLPCGMGLQFAERNATRDAALQTTLADMEQRAAS